MGMLMSAIILKLINLFIIVFALSLHASKGLSISPSPIEVALGPSSNGKPFTSDPPISVSRPIGSPLELASPPEASPPLDLDPPISMPVDQAPSPSEVRANAPIVPPTASQGKEPVIEIVAPVATPPKISPAVLPSSPVTSPPAEPIAPVSIASPPRELGKSPPAPVELSPSQPPKISPFIDPTSASPSMLPDHSITPMSSPPTISNWKNEGVPVAAPSNEKPRPSSPPMSHIPDNHGSNIAPSPSNLLPKSHTKGQPPALSPSTPFEKPYNPRNITTNPTPAPSHPLSPPSSNQHGPAVPPAPFRARRHGSYHAPPPGPPPLKPDPLISPSHVPFSPPASHVSPTPTPSQKASAGPTRKDFPSKPPLESPKAPLLPQLPAFPPPPPNEDCSTIICAEPYTNTPPGSPCGCVMPIQVGLRLSVSLYTFFPLVSELAEEIAAGVFVKQSQVRIVGANAANQQPDKTVILVDLVPLGERFDNATAFLTYQRFWNKQVTIQTNYFGDYEVLYVRYPGLPESPPSGSGIIDDGLYPGSNNNNGRKIKPLSVDLPKSQSKNGLSSGVIAVIVLSASLGVIFCAIAAWIFLFKRRDGGSKPGPTSHVLLPALSKASGSRESSATLSFGSSIATYTGSAKTFTAMEIEKATDHFSASRVLGEGGFGRVYRGVFEDGTEVAVKVLKRVDHQGGREFLAEVEMLSRLHHRNLVKLIGICTDERSRCLVYELIPNGSLESHLHGIDKESAPLDWGARIKIALGAARGLAYLHEDSSPRVIHRDFKSSNILLEDDFTPKVADFGLARTALDEENCHISTRVMGTFGYVAPEYAMTGHLLVKSDVYSYGVVLLELLTGRKPVDMSQPPGEENLVAWARPLLTSKEGLESIADRSLVGPGPRPAPSPPFDSIARVAAIASMCVQPEVSNRPFMGEVVQALKLVSNEIEGSRASSRRDDLSLDLGSSGQFVGPFSTRSYGSSSDLDVSRGGGGLSGLASELFGPASVRAAAVGPAEESESFRRHSSSGPLGGRRRPFWGRERRSSGGSVSEHGDAFRLWPGSH